MTKTRAWLLVGIVLIAGAYMAGYWPERQRLQEAEVQVAAIEARAAEAERQVRLAELLGLLLRLSDAVEALNYGDASAQATRYFDRVATEIPLAGQPDVQTALQDIHQTRDRVIAALARAEAPVVGTLRQQEHALRRALGYPVPDEPVMPPVPPAVPGV